MSATVQLSLSTAEQLLAIEEIKRVKSAYALAADRHNWDDFVSLFAPDAAMDESDFPRAFKPFTNEWVSEEIAEYLEQFSSGTDWPIIGREAILNQHTGVPADYQMVHHLANPIIELTSDSTATAIHRYESFHTVPNGQPVQFLHILGIYDETYVRLEDGRWYIQSMKLERLRIECQ